jgi:membrane protease YdiL (CAAX protease family)
VSLPPRGDAPPPTGKPYPPGAGLPPQGPAYPPQDPPYPPQDPAYLPVDAVGGVGDEVRYHRLVVWRGGAWWRFLVALLFGAIGLVLGPLIPVVGVLLVAHAIGHGFTFSLDDGLNAAEMLALNLGLALLIPIAALTYWMLYQRPRWLGSLKPRLRWRWLGLCTLMALAVWGLLMILATGGAAASRQGPIDSAVIWFLVVVLLTTPLQAAGEEYLFRGLLLQGLGATRLPTWACCVVSGLVFATAHLQFDPPLFADRFLLGVVFAWLAIRSGGLEAGIAIHTVKNLAGLIPAALLDDVSDTLDPSGVNWLPVAVDAVLLAILVPWLARVIRNRSRDGRLMTFRRVGVPRGV